MIINWIIQYYTKKIRESSIDNFYIELYENIICENREQLTKREGEVIRQIGTLNIKIAGRTRKEYRENNKDKIKEYREKNQDKIIAQTNTNIFRGSAITAELHSPCREFKKKHTNNLDVVVNETTKVVETFPGPTNSQESN